MSFIDSLGQNSQQPQQTPSLSGGSFINNLGSQNQVGVLPAPPSLMQNISSDIQTRGANVNSALTSTEGNSNNPFVQGTADLSHGLQAAGQAAMGVVDTAGDIGSSLLKHLGINPTQQPGGKQGQTPLGQAVSGTASKAYDELGIRLNSFVNQHPEVGKVLTNILGAGQGAGNVSNAVLTGDMVAGGAQKTVDLAKQGIAKGQEVVSNATDSIKNTIKGSPENDLQKINETITPKPTIKEAKLAETQGRLYKGSDPTMFKAGGEDKIATSVNQADSARTIQRLIPNAATMDEPTLYSALDDKIGETAEQLKPAMQATPIQEETVQKITDDWNALKTSQKADAYLPDNVNIEKLQSDFEQRLQKSANGSMNDLWDTRKAYDASVPSNVKSATDISSDALQAKKQIWLQNRAILSNAINDTTNGMGSTSQQAFKEMNNMYDAQRGILSKAKVVSGTAPSKFSTIKKAIADHPIVSGVAGIEGARKIVTGHF